MGFAAGFRAGYDTVRDVQERRRKEELRQGLQRAGALEAQTIGGTRQATPEEFARAQAEAQALGQQDAAMFGLTSEDEMGMYSPAVPSPTAQVTTPTQYQLGGITRATPFTQPEIQRARTEEMARVYEQQGMPAEAMQMRGLAAQQELTGMQLTQARRQEDYNNALQEINKQKFADPTERTAAILAATEAFDPATALKLRNEYTQAELNDITLKAKKFEQNYAQSRAKGLDAVIEWYDSVNDGFTLRREGNQIIQTDTAGNQRVFAQGTDDQIMMRMDAIAKPGGFLELAKAEADTKKAEAQARQAEATARYLDRDKPRAGAGLRNPPSEADIRGFIEMYADSIVPGMQGPDRRPMILRDLSPEDQRSFALRVMGGTTGTPGLPDIPGTGLPLPGAVAPRPEAPTQGLVPASPRAARAATARQDTIPQPPPQTITTRGGVTRVNPDYLEWERQYGRLLGPQ